MPVPVDRAPGDTISAEDINAIAALANAAEGAIDATVGPSAYDVWLSAGNVGTEAEFIDSLKGPTGPAGTPFITVAQGDAAPAGTSDGTLIIELLPEA